MRRTLVRSYRYAAILSRGRFMAAPLRKKMNKVPDDKVSDTTGGTMKNESRQPNKSFRSSRGSDF